MNKQNKSQVLISKAAKSIKAKEKAKKKARPVGPLLASGLFKAPVAQTRIRRNRDPDINHSRDGKECVVTHTEFLRDISGSVDFAVTATAVNPGLQTSFPWLSAIANNYESYCFEALEYEFQNASNTTYTGTVMAAVDYDASDPAPGSKVALASYEGFVRSAPWQDFNNRSPTQDLKKRTSYYVRSGALSANQDIKLYDTGNFFIATQGQATTAPVGELYVHYRCRFRTPQLQDPAVGLSRSAKITSTNTVNTTVAASNAPLVVSGTLGGTGITLTASAPYNALVVMAGNLSVGVPVPVTTGSTCTIQSAVTRVVGVNYTLSAEVAFLPGQTLVFDVGSNADWVSNAAQIGQYNTLLL